MKKKKRYFCNPLTGEAYRAKPFNLKIFAFRYYKKDGQIFGYRLRWRDILARKY